MDRIFVCEKNYIENKDNYNNVLLHWCLNHYVPYYLDSIEIIEIDDIKDIACDIRNGKTIIPVGDLTFVRKWLETIDKKQRNMASENIDTITSIPVADKDMIPIEIPECLKYYIKREYHCLQGKELLTVHKEFLQSSKYFVKDASHLKQWNSLLYSDDISYYIEPETYYTVSERVDFLSEWRIFVYNGEVQNSMYYLGDNPTTYPDETVINHMVDSIENDSLLSKLGAYTIDIGVMRNNDNQLITTPIEVHPFVACGLYGFCDREILNMIEQGYNWYRYNYNIDLKISGTA